MMESPILVVCIVIQMNKGGMESRLMDIYRNIDRSKVQFHFYTCSLDSGDFDEEIKELGGIIYYNEPLNIKKIFSIPTRFFNFFIDHPEYKIVHAHINQWCGLILKGAKKAKIPIRIAHSRTSLDKLTFKNIVKNVVKLPTNYYATHKFAVSKKAARWLYGRNYDDVIILPNAIKNELYSYDQVKREKKRAELDLNDSFTLVHIGNLRLEKNHEFLLSIFKEIKKEENDIKLILVGKDNLNGSIQRLAIELGVFEDVLFLGQREDVSDLLQAGDVFVFPSIYEGLPGAVLEAQASGIPCIISNTITSEVVITPLVKQLSLKRNNEEWVNKIRESKGHTRRNTNSYFEKSGFDIKSLVKKLTLIYTDYYESN